MSLPCFYRETPRIQKKMSHYHQPALELAISWFGLPDRVPIVHPGIPGATTSSFFIFLILLLFSLYLSSSPFERIEILVSFLYSEFLHHFLLLLLHTSLPSLGQVLIVLIYICLLVLKACLFYVNIRCFSLVLLSHPSLSPSLRLPSGGVSLSEDGKQTKTPDNSNYLSCIL